MSQLDKLTKQIMELTYMIDGINIALHDIQKAHEQIIYLSDTEEECNIKSSVIDTIKRQINKSRNDLIQQKTMLQNEYDESYNRLMKWVMEKRPQ